MEHMKREIERLVAPLPAGERRKNALRQELWAHFVALHEEERAIGPDAEAEERALARLGTAEVIAASFVQQVPALEQRLYALDARIKRRPGESPFGYARRVSLWVLFVFVVLTAVAGLLSCGLFLGKPQLGTPWLPALLVSTVTLWGTVWHLVTLWQFSAMTEPLRVHPRPLRCVLRVCLMNALFALAMAFLAFGGGYGVNLLLFGASHVQTLSYLYVCSLALGFVMTTSMFSVYYAVVRDLQHNRPIPDWPYQSRA